MATTLPAEVLDLVQFHPIEDLLLAVFRDAFSQVEVITRYSKDQGFPVILLRRIDSWGRPDRDDRFVQTHQVVVHTLCNGLNAEEDASLLAEAAKVVLTNSVNKVMPGLGHVTMVDPISLPNMAPDWATSTGPVQYADLPTGVVRYEGIYEVAFRRPV